MRRRGLASLSGAALAALFVGAAQADHAPAFVVPGRSDVPVMINGYDASWGVVNGDWGLYRPGAVGLTIYPAPFVPRHPYHRPVPRYFPSLGAAPQVGRYEVNPPAHRPLPPQAQPYHRSWSAESDPGPVTDYAPTGPMFISPEVDVWRGRRGHRP